jgi:hypothetical protein
MQVSDPNLTAGRDLRTRRAVRRLAPSGEFQNASHLNRGKGAREGERRRGEPRGKATTGEVRGDGVGKARGALPARVSGAIGRRADGYVFRPAGPSAALALRPSFGDDGSRAT